MGSSVVPLIFAATASTTTSIAPHASVGSTVGPALPVILALAVVGFVIHLIRKRKRTSSSNGPYT
jgi:hypothetical protein